jgi:uncharacterized membrane protein
MAQQEANAKNWHQKHAEGLSVGQKVADRIATGMGSWAFIITQTVLIVVWIALNLIGFFMHWDPYPFILLNLLFSTQAAYAAPIIMMAQNRQNERDRMHAEEDFKTNVKAELEIEALQKALAVIDRDKLDKIIGILNRDNIVK